MSRAPRQATIVQHLDPARLTPVLRAWLERAAWVPRHLDLGTLSVREIVPLGEAGAIVLAASATGDSTHTDSTVADTALPSDPDGATRLALPVQLERLPPERMGDPGWIGAFTDAAGEPRYLRDGAYSPDFLTELLDVLGLGPQVEHRWDTSRARLLTSQQTNQSIVVPARDDAELDVIVKLYRTTAPGSHLEAELSGALTAAGWPHTPALLGAWEAPAAPPTTRRRDRLLGRRKTPASYPLAIAHEFVADAVDGFAFATAPAQVCDPDAFTAHAARLGEITKAMHRQLADTLGTLPPPSGADLVRALDSRAAWATSAVPDLERFAAPLAELGRELATRDDLPPRQRIHADLHLGQLLHHEHRGWLVIDFEGEPDEIPAQRGLPDLALRDVAGLTRSIDYASAAGGAPEGWRQQSLRALLDAYGLAEQDWVVLRTLEVHKALYEVVYEARHRPDWIGIPLAALDRLLVG